MEATTRTHLRPEPVERAMGATHDYQHRVEQAITSTMQRMFAGLDPDTDHLAFELRVAVAAYVARMEAHHH